MFGTVFSFVQCINTTGQTVHDRCVYFYRLKPLLLVYVLFKQLLSSYY